MIDPAEITRENSPTLAAHYQAAESDIVLSSMESAYIAEAVLAASGLRERVAVLEAQKQTALADAWDDGYSRAESDHWGTGFWAIGMRENPFRALGGEETT